MNEKISPKPVKERNNIDLLELVCQLHSRSVMQTHNQDMHDAYIEARTELESRLTKSPVPDKVEVKTDDNTINHIRNIKLLQAIHSGKKFYVDCYPTDKGAICFPNSNKAVKEIELPEFELYEEKFGYKWQTQQSDAVEFGNWLNETNWAEKETWGKYDPPSMPTMEQLYEIFKKSKQ